MLNKYAVSLVSAALLAAGPLEAAAQTVRGPVTGASVTPALGAGLLSPVPSASAFNRTALSMAAPISLVPALAPSAANAAAKPVPAAPLLPAAAQSVTPALAKASPLAVIQSPNPSAGTPEIASALDAVFDNAVRAGKGAFAAPVHAAASVGDSRDGRAPKSAKLAAAVAPRLKDAVIKINDYMEKERMSQQEGGKPLTARELADLTGKLNWLADPKTIIPRELLGHLEGVSIAIRLLLTEGGPVGRNVRDAVAAARKLEEKVRAQS